MNTTEELIAAAENLVFTATKLWDEVKPIKDSEAMTVTHPMIEEMKEAIYKAKAELEQSHNSDELQKGCIVLMNKESGLEGYGNYQCVSHYSKELGTIGLYGHNQHYKSYDIKKIIEYPQSKPTPTFQGHELKLPELLLLDDGASDDYVTGYNTAVNYAKELNPTINREAVKVEDRFIEFIKKYVDTESRSGFQKNMMIVLADFEVFKNNLTH